MVITAKSHRYEGSGSHLAEKAPVVARSLRLIATYVDML